MSNALNNGNLIGRLAADPRAFANTDGSKKVVFTVYADRAYRNAEGQTISDAIAVEAFVSNKVDGLGPFGHIHQGDLVALSTHIEQLSYKAKNGETVFPAAKIVVDNINFLESRSATNARLAKRTVAADAPAAEAAPAAEEAKSASAYDNDAPFAEAAH
ncbi:UNVERIFIED_ORG: single-strand DNA-binding protein [Arthrobacter sp. UYCu721]